MRDQNLTTATADMPAPTPIVSSALLGGEVHGILKKAGGYAFALTGLGMVLCLITKLTGDAGLNIIASIITTFGFGALNALLLVCWRLQAKGILPPPNIKAEPPPVSGGEAQGK